MQGKHHEILHQDRNCLTDKSYCDGNDYIPVNEVKLSNVTFCYDNEPKLQIRHGGIQYNIRKKEQQTFSEYINK
jgi:hypothetical protein